MQKGNNLKKKKLIIFGSRSLRGNKVAEIIKTTLQKKKINEVITSGGIRGVCLEAQKVCQRLAMPVKLIFPDFTKYARGAFSMRSKAIITEGDMALVIHDGISKGTANELKLLEKTGIKYEYYTMQPEEITELTITDEELEILK